MSRRTRWATRARTHQHLLAGSAALVVGAAVQAVSGALFWLIAARLDDTDDVGRATALFSSILFLAYLGGLGQQVALARFSPGRDEESHAVFSWAVLATSAWSATLAGGYLLIVDSSATRSLTDWHPIAGPVCFIAATVGAQASLLVDVRWMTVRRWGWVLARIAIVGAARFPLLAVPTGGDETVHLFLVACGPLLVSGFVGTATMHRSTGARHRIRRLGAVRRSYLRYSAVNYLSTLAYQGPQFVLPVIVLLSVDPDRNAAFYVAWGITAMTLYVPMAIGQALLAEGGKDGAELTRQVRLVLVVTVGLMVLATVVASLGRGLVTTVYGDDYADAARLLPALVAACIPWALTSVFLTEARVLHRHVDTVAITGVLTVSMLIPALLLIPDDGLDGARTAFVIGNVAAAILATGFHLAGRSRAPRLVPPTDPIDEDLVLHP